MNDKNLLEQIWRLLVAIFILVAVGVVLAVGYMIGAQRLFAVVFYAGMLAVPIAIAMGVFAIIDHNRENRNKEE